MISKLAQRLHIFDHVLCMMHITKIMLFWLEIPAMIRDYVLIPTSHMYSCPYAIKETF